MKDFAKSIHVGNATIKFYGETIDLTKESESYLKEILEELQALHEQSDAQRAIKEELAKRKRTGNSKCGNAEVVKDGDAWVVLYAEGTKSKEFDSEAEAKRFAAQVGNSKVGNGITKFGLGNYVIADGHKAIVLGETVERGPNGIPFGWVTIRWVEGPWKGQSDQQYDYDLKKA